MTLLQTVIYFVYKLLLNYRSLKQLPAANRIHLPAERCASTHSTQHTELAAGQLSRFHHKRPTASKFAEYISSGLSRVVCNVGGSLQAKKAKNHRRTQGIASSYLEQPTTRTDGQDCERLLKLSD